MTDAPSDTCPIPVDTGRTCGATLRWEVTPERDVEPYVACGQHITAPIMRADELVAFSARPIR